MSRARVLLCSLVFLCLTFALAGCGGGTVRTYSVEGYVLCNGVELADVSVSCEGSTVNSDENGFFRIDELTEAAVLRAEKENYVFSPDSLSVSFFANTCTFNAYPIYDLTGRVESNGTPIQGALVSAEGLKGGSVQTDRNGRFFLQNVAGELTVSVTAEGYTFLNKTVHAGGDELVFDGIYRAFGRVTAGGEPLAGVTVSDGKVSAVTGEDGSYSLDKVGAYAELTAGLEGYSFEPAAYVVDRENNEANFEGFPVYAIAGRAHSGTLALEGALIRATDGERTFETRTAGDGSFSLEVYCPVEVTCTYEGFDFGKLNFDAAGTADFDGTFEAVVTALSRGNPLAGLSVGAGAETGTTGESGEAALRLRIGEEVTGTLEGYHVPAVTVRSTDDLELSAYPLYDLSIAVTFDGQPFGEALVALDGRELTLDNGSLTLEGQWGDHLLTAALEGYAFTISDPEIDENNHEISVTADKYYSISGSVRSGERGSAVTGTLDLFREGRTERSVEVRDGSYTLADLLGEYTLSFRAQGYITQAHAVSHRTEGQVNFDLKYNLKGRVISRDLSVAEASVKATDETGAPVETRTLSDGTFLLEGLTGEAVVTVSKEGYDFPTNEATVCDPYAEPVFDGTYSVSGVVFVRDQRMDENGNPVEQDGLPVYDKKLLSDILIFGAMGDQTPLADIVTGADGAFSYSGLHGSGRLMAHSEEDARRVFKPSVLRLRGAGDGTVYYFEADAFSVEGKVTSGGLPVEGVAFRTSEKEVLSNASGVFFFEVLKNTGTITPYKEGYVFSPASYTISSREDVRDLSFTCTYSVSGRVQNGGTPLAGVLVKLGEKSVLTDAEGGYSFEGLSGENRLELVREGYVFTGDFEVSGYDAARNFESTYEVSGRVLTGDLPVAGVLVKRGDSETRTLEDGSFTLRGLSGEGAISFALPGYVFPDSDRISEFSQGIEISGTYSVRGRVTTGGIPVAQAVVRVGDTSIMTGADGAFAFEGLSGTNEVVCTMAGYLFGNVSVSGYDEDLSVTGTYTYTVNVVVGGKPLPGVRVSGFGAELTTDESGSAVFSGLTGAGNFTFEKAGYSFETLEVTGAGTRDVSARFSISGFVLTGGIPVPGVLVTCGSQTVETKTDGAFRFEGLSGSATVKLSREGYTFESGKIYTEYTSDIEISATYEVYGNVVCEDNQYGGVTVSVTYGEPAQTYKAALDTASGGYRYAGISGIATLTFTREGNFRFERESFTVGEAGDLGVNNCGKVFRVTGTVSAGGTPLPNVKVKATNKKLETYTDGTGAFAFETVVGQTSFQAVVEYADLDGKKSTLTTDTKTVKGETSVKLEFDQKKFAVAYLCQAYEKLGQISFSSSTSGTAIADAPVVGKQVQEVRGFKKRDTQGNYLMQNLNHGAVVMGKEPRVAHMAYVSAAGAVEYKEVRGESVASPDTANYPAGWTGMSVADYKARYGGLPTRFTPYVVTDGTVDSVSGFTAGTEGISFTVTFDPASSTRNYKTQMKAYSQQDIANFTKVVHTYVFDGQGRLKSIHFDEIYIVNTGVSIAPQVSCVNNIDETFSYTAMDSVNKPE